MKNIKKINRMHRETKNKQHHQQQLQQNNTKKLNLITQIN